MKDLIERLEKADRGSHALDFAVWRQLHPEALIEDDHCWSAGAGRFKAYHTAESKAQWERLCLDAGFGHGLREANYMQHGEVRPYTTSLDAARSLLPEGWRYGIEQAGRFDGNDLCEAWCWRYESAFDPDWRSGDQGYRSAPDAVRAAHADDVLSLTIAALKACQEKETPHA